MSKFTIDTKDTIDVYHSDNFPQERQLYKHRHEGNETDAKSWGHMCSPGSITAQRKVSEDAGSTYLSVEHGLRLVQEDILGDIMPHWFCRRRR